MIFSGSTPPPTSNTGKWRFHMDSLLKVGGGFNCFSFSCLLGDMIQFDEHIVQMGWFNHQLHPGRLTWNLKMMVWKMIFLSKWVIFRFHVNLPGCRKTCNHSLDFCLSLFIFYIAQYYGFEEAEDLHRRRLLEKKNTFRLLLLFPWEAWEEKGFLEKCIPESFREIMVMNDTLLYKR